MEDNKYTPNSHRYKEEQKQKQNDIKIEKVVTGNVTTRKKSSIRKFTEEFISEDAKNVKSYIFGDVLIPAIKKAIVDTVTDSIQMIFYGESRRGTKRSTSDRVSYRNYYDNDRPYVRDSRPYTQQALSYDDVIIPSRGEAEEVLRRMDEIMDMYGLVRVADLYDLVGITANPIDNKYGWTNIRNANIERVRTNDGYGYVINLPRAIQID